MTDTHAIRSAEDLRAWCRAIDRACAEQFEEIAEAFAMSNNRDAAEELLALADWKSRHAEGESVAVEWHPSDWAPSDWAPSDWAPSDWYVIDPGDPDAVHYLMQPWHVVRIALANEDRLLERLHDLAARPTATPVRDAVDALLARQRARIHHLQGRLAELPEPEAGWDDDPDPPFFDQ